MANVVAERRAAEVEIAAELRAALDALAAAMVRRDADGVLDAEAILQRAVSRRGDVSASATPESRNLVRAEVAAARATLARCRALGQGSGRLLAATLEALGAAPSYGRHGAGTSRNPRRRALTARV